jgi:hypothetical protein
METLRPRVARTNITPRACLGFLHYDGGVGGRTLATAENGGDLAALASLSPGTFAVVFPAVHRARDRCRTGRSTSQTP